jgi:tetratricopeptide (TPR) repeat protein
MKKNIWLLACVLLLASCNPKKAWDKKSIEKRENALMENAKKGKVDTVAVNDLLKSYEAFADAYPADTNGANYLFKAADFYRYLHQAQRSVNLYDKIYKNYPAFEKRPYALFLQGFVYENDIANFTEARNKYQEFLSAYPNHAIAHDVKITMDNLGKSPEQLMQEITAQHLTDSVNVSVK